MSDPTHEFLSSSKTWWSLTMPGWSSWRWISASRRACLQERDTSQTLQSVLRIQLRLLLRSDYERQWLYARVLTFCKQFTLLSATGVTSLCPADEGFWIVFTACSLPSYLPASLCWAGEVCRLHSAASADRSPVDSNWHKSVTISNRYLTLYHWWLLNKRPVIKLISNGWFILCHSM